MQIVTASKASLASLLKAARKYEHIELIGEGDLNSMELVLKPGKPIAGDSAVEMLCAAIRDGVVLAELLNIFLPPRQRLQVWKPGAISEVASIITDTVELADDATARAMKVATGVTEQATKTTLATVQKTASVVPGSAGDLASAAVKKGEQAMDATLNVTRFGADQMHAADRAQDLQDRNTCRPNVQRFIAALTDPDLPFRLDTKDVCSADDVLHVGRGSQHDKQTRQKKVLKCLLSLAMEVLQIDDYLGPKIDEVNLGTLSPGAKSINQPKHLQMTQPCIHKLLPQETFSESSRFFRWLQAGATPGQLQQYKIVFCTCCRSQRLRNWHKDFLT